MKKLLFIVLLGSCGASLASEGKGNTGMGILEKNYDMLLNPKKYGTKRITKATKNLKDDGKNFDAALDFLEKSKSDILFPGLHRYIWIKNGYSGASAEALFMPDALDQKRDEEILGNLFVESVKNEKLLPFIEKGYENFKKQYNTTLSFKTILVNNTTLGAFFKDNKKDAAGKTYPAYRLFTKLQSKSGSSQEKASGSWKKVFVAGAVGLVGVGAYLLYRYKIKSQDSIADALEGGISQAA